MSSHPPEVPLFATLLVGQDLHGRWLVQDSDGLIEGFFQSERAALGFARCEAEIHSLPVEISPGPLSSHLNH